MTKPKPSRPSPLEGESNEWAPNRRDRIEQEVAWWAANQEDYQPSESEWNEVLNWFLDGGEPDAKTKPV